jgi:hypothetical protein
MQKPSYEISPYELIDVDMTFDSIRGIWFNKMEDTKTGKY